METGRLKRFAVEARSILRLGVQAKIKTLGFNADGSLMAGVEAPVEVPGGCVWNGQILPTSFAQQWMALQHRIDTKGISEVVEEGAYMWFNRLMALRILAKNNVCEPMLRFVDEARTPKIVDDARQGRVIPMPEDQRNRLRELFKDPTAVNEQFALLITEYCHQTPVVQACFGSLADYTELLLPANILAEGGFIDKMNQDDFISDEDYRSAELIGWLYQFYISDRKDEVFAKKGKVEADEIPAATQIFTPNWIVKYMVQNAVLPQVRSSRLPDSDKEYLIEHEAPEAPKRPADLRVADLACGSGHILNECFDLLFDLYIASGFSRSAAIENIFRHNLVGVDIDKRARQLSTFALMLKACQRDESMVDAHVMPQVLSMPELEEPSEEIATAKREHFYSACDITGTAREELDAAFTLMRNADSLGSIMKFDISAPTRRLIEQTIAHFTFDPDARLQRTPYYRSLPLILALTDSYDAIVMNPPYMPTGKTPGLKEYAAKNYPDSKADLFSVFMDVCINHLKDGGKYGMINMQSWMFLSSFEALRKRIIDTQQIDSLLHLGPRTFDELSGEVVQNAAFVISKSAPSLPGIYYRLIDGKNCNAKREMFLAGDNRYVIADQKQYEQIPGSPIAYWVSEKMLQTFANNAKLEEIAKPRQGLATSDNGRFLRLWHEVNFLKVGINCKSGDESSESGKKWFPLLKGGSERRWYGNLEYAINWENNGYEVLEYAASLYGSPTRTIKNIQFYFKENITWGRINAGCPTFRYTPVGTISETAGCCVFVEDTEALNHYLALLNSKIFAYALGAINPTLCCQTGDVGKIPIVSTTMSISSLLNDLVRTNIAISKQDWDAHETSWDFQTNELIALTQEGAGINESWIGNQDNVIAKYGYIQPLMLSYADKWETLFRQLHANEEELNRQFIEIYGLQDELTPEVPLDEVTILQQGEVKIEGGELHWNRDVIIKQLISYIVGCYMGRYRLDRPGLAIAHPNPSADELAPYDFCITGSERFTLDDDAIIPILPNGAPFDDNLTEYISQFVMKVWGAESHMENLNFMEECLGKKLEDYVQKDFWKDHKKMYQNRPIYWLFSSKKGAFKALVYAHRMTPYTAEQVRSRYLLKYMDWLRAEAQRLEIRQADLSTKERKRLDRLRADLTECDEYHERLQVVAESEIRFDLDDGIPHNHALFGDVVVKLK